ncbi:MAG: hypothetical protein NTW49_14185 [Bacteroidia bacterium]|nr:hypothetical protein [Bacteroidia bacterium]
MNEIYHSGNLRIMKYVFVILLFVFLIGCEKDKYFNIPNDKLPIYKYYDTLVYKSNLGNYDTLFIWSYSKYYEVIDKQDYNQFISFSFVKSLNIGNSSILGIYTIEHNKFEITWEDYSELIYFDSLKNPISMTVNNVYYPEVYELKSNYTLIDRLYFTYKYCVIKYFNNSGEYFDLVKY